MDRRSLLLLGPRRLEWVADEVPGLKSGEVLIRTLYGSLSVGAEVPQYAGYARRSRPPAYPLMTGYEALGLVEARGAGIRRLSVGDRVVAFYGHRTRAAVPESRVIRTPDDIPHPLALLAILSCDMARGVNKIGVKVADRILITGAGAVGLLTLFNLRARGARHVDVVEPRAARRELAGQLGARATFHPADAQGEGGYQAGFECSSAADAFGILQARVTKGGRICVLSDGNVEPLTLSPAFHEKELQVVSSSDGENYQRHGEWFFKQIREGWGVLRHLFDLEIEAAELPALFERIRRGEVSPIKVLVSYPGAPGLDRAVSGSGGVSGR